MSLEFPHTNLTDRVEILKFVAREWIRPEPLRYDQDIWATFTDQVWSKNKKFPTCGTICCVAGAVVLATKGRPSITNGEYYNWAIHASEILQLTDDESEKLFSGSAIDFQFRHENPTLDYDQVPEQGTVEYAELGIRHIERFMRKYMGYEGDPL